MNSDDSLCEVYVAHRCAWDPALLLSAFTTISSTLSNLGFEPDRVAIELTGQPMKFASLRAAQARLGRVDAADIASIELVRLLPEGRNELTQWLVESRISKQRQVLELGCAMSIPEHARTQLGHQFRALASLSAAQYGYCFRQKRKLVPTLYAAGMSNYAASRPRDAGMNISWWEPHSAQQLNRFLLRDIFARNFLSPEYLNRPVGRSSKKLGEWIAHDAVARGTLNPLTNELFEWNPPIKNIPVIREALYRAGRIFYWRFFSPTFRDAGVDRPEPLFRPDLSAPWEAPDPIPEIYRADFWKDKEPGLTY